MNLARVIFFSVVIFLCGCAKEQVEEIHLIDGRVLKTDKVYNDGERLQFKADGFEYNFPSFFRAEGKADKSMTMSRVKVSDDSILTPEGTLDDFKELAEYLDRMATRETPLIVEMIDAVSWTEARRQEFGKTYGGVRERPYVGLEGYWPEKWLPGEPGRELPSE